MVLRKKSLKHYFLTTEAIKNYKVSLIRDFWFEECSLVKRLYKLLNDGIDTKLNIKLDDMYYWGNFRISDFPSELVTDFNRNIVPLINSVLATPFSIEQLLNEDLLVSAIEKQIENCIALLYDPKYNLIGIFPEAQSLISIKRELDCICILTQTKVVS